MAEKPKFTTTNLDALAIIAAFHNKLRRAGTFSGRMTILKTTRREGKIVSTKTAEVQSSWIRDKSQEGVHKKSAFNIVYTAVEDGKTTVEKLSVVDDGIKQYSFN